MVMESKPVPPPINAVINGESDFKEEKYALEQWLISLAPNHIYDKLGLGADFFDRDRWFLHGVERGKQPRAFADEFGAIRSVDTFVVNCIFRHTGNKSQVSVCLRDDDDGDGEYEFCGDFSTKVRDGESFTGNGLIMTERHVKEAAMEYSACGSISGAPYFPEAAKSPGWGEW